jgi:hypothetical protein
VDWWIVVVLVLVLFVGPPYAYFVCKFAGAGWFAGIGSYIRSRRRGEDR